MLTTVKNLVRDAIAAPGVRDGLRWFLTRPALPDDWRDYAHRKIAKRARFPEGTTFTYRTPEGVTLELQHTGTANYLYWLDDYEPETTGVFRRLVRSCTTVLDIGAADGLYALLAAAANPNATVHAFEPVRGAAQTFAANLALNPGLAARVQLHELALGARDGEATIYVAGSTGGTSSLNPAFRRDHTEQRVRVRRGDALMAELGVPRVELIKMDTESTEPDVLLGFGELLARDRPDVICEVLAGRTEDALETILAPLGYRYFAMTLRGLEERQHIVGDATYRAPNYLFTHKPAAALQRLTEA